MLRNLALLIVLIVAGLGLSWFYGSAPPAAPVVASQQTDYKPAPDFAFATLDGETHRLGDFRGRAVLLNFWASWCVPCRVEFPQLMALAKARPQDVVIIALSVDKDEAAMQKFLGGFDGLKALSNFLVARDADKAISQDLFQTLRYPETILIGPDGTMRRKYLGIELAWDGPEFAAELDRMR